MAMVTAKAHGDHDSADAVTGDVEDPLELEVIAQAAAQIAAVYAGLLATATGETLDHILQLMGGPHTVLGRPHAEAHRRALPRRVTTS